MCFCSTRGPKTESKKKSFGGSPSLALGLRSEIKPRSGEASAALQFSRKWKQSADKEFFNFYFRGGYVHAVSLAHFFRTHRTHTDHDFHSFVRFRHFLAGTEISIPSSSRNKWSVSWEGSIVAARCAHLTIRKRFSKRETETQTRNTSQSLRHSMKTA